MAIPAYERQKAFESASLHALVALESIEDLADRPYATIRVVGKVAKIFGGAGLTRVGESAAFDLPVVRKGVADIPMGGSICWYEDLLNTQFIEVCLDGKPPDFCLAADLYEVIDRETDEPAIRFSADKEEATPERKSWWRRFF